MVKKKKEEEEEVDSNVCVSLLQTLKMILILISSDTLGLFGSMILFLSLTFKLQVHSFFL